MGLIERRFRARLRQLKANMEAAKLNWNPKVNFDESIKVLINASIDGSSNR